LFILSVLIFRRNFFDFWNRLKNYTGRTTGEHINKFYETKLTKKPTKLIRSYLIEEFILSLECVKKDKISFSEHTLFIGQVVNVESKDGEFKIPLTYDYRKYTYQSDEVIEF
jgi:flavin reductase (DIM6/NTAB) family NADH-FMN oxidoreductase RutF